MPVHQNAFQPPYPPSTGPYQNNSAPFNVNSSAPYPTSDSNLPPPTYNQVVHENKQPAFNPNFNGWLRSLAIKPCDVHQHNIFYSKIFNNQPVLRIKFTKRSCAQTSRLQTGLWKARQGRRDSWWQWIKCHAFIFAEEKQRIVEKFKSFVLENWKKSRFCGVAGNLFRRQIRFNNATERFLIFQLHEHGFVIAPDQSITTFGFQNKDYYAVEAFYHRVQWKIAGSASVAPIGISSMQITRQSISSQSHAPSQIRFEATKLSFGQLFRSFWYFR